MKKIIFILAFFLAGTAAFSFDMPFFSGYAGFLGDIAHDKDRKDFDAEFRMESFFSGQLDFSGNLLLRAEFYMATQDLVDSNLFEESESENAFFNLGEVSATFKLSTYRSSHYFTLFMGSFEPIGSDIFLQRQFGIQPIGARFTESWHSLSGASVYPFYGTGISYVYHPENSGAAAIYAYMNKQTFAEETRKVLNADIRVARLFPNLTLDLSAGVGFPLENTDANGNDVVLLIQEVQLHAGFNILLGNRYTSSLFAQGGFTDFVLASSSENSKKTISFSDLYFYLEPRFHLRKAQIHLALFNLPRDSADDMLYLKEIINSDSTINNLLGVNLCTVTDNLYIGNTNFTFGIHSSYMVTNADLEEFKKDFKAIKNWDMKLYITPFLSVPVLGGTMNGSFTVNVFNLKNDIHSSLMGTVGFKTQF
ncbi:MAG: hypothetical protein J5780_00525 [Treponema sp.]|nr:hypothetical protein [Treponema sp.]